MNTFPALLHQCFGLSASIITRIEQYIVSTSAGKSNEASQLIELHTYFQERKASIEVLTV